MHLSSTLKEHHGKPCSYCERPMDLGRTQLMPTRDHYPVPKSRGGKMTIICCYTCNHLKSDMTAEEWGELMRENKGGWFSRRSREAPLPPIPSGKNFVPLVPAKPLPIMETQMILQHGKKVWRSWKADIKPAPLVCPVMTMVSEFFMRLKYPNAYRMPPPSQHL